MSSILTNNSAMVALQTLQSVNSNLAKTQDMISTGKEVGSAKDNSAVFAISKVMESDISGFKAISDSLSLGEATVGVKASERSVGLPIARGTQRKGKIVGPRARTSITPRSRPISPNAPNRSVASSARRSSTGQPAGDSVGDVDRQRPATSRWRT